MRAHAQSNRTFNLGALLLAVAGTSLLLAALAGFSSARANALQDAQVLREGGCGGLARAPHPLRHVHLLDRAAALWASGDSLAEAAKRAGYPAEHLAGIHVTGDDAGILQLMRHSDCSMLLNRHLTDAGVYRRGRGTWLLLASTYVIPRSTLSPASAARVLALVNAVRERGTTCGRRRYRPTTPVQLSPALGQIARGHARDMAKHAYFEHEDLSGRTPADRVRAAGYDEQVVGENIAFGPTSAEEVVRGWLHSPGHCANIMDPRFAQMGIAYAFGPAPSGASGAGLYWVQDLADPR